MLLFVLLSIVVIGATAQSPILISEYCTCIRYSCMIEDNPASRLAEMVQVLKRK